MDWLVTFLIKLLLGFLSMICVLWSMLDSDGDAVNVDSGRAMAAEVRTDDEKPKLPKDSLSEDLMLTEAPLGLEKLPESPAENPLTPAKVKLGRKLFFDPILSSDGTVSCASCHQPEYGFASPEPMAIGLRGEKTKRNAPSLINRAYGKHFFWDGRSATLEQQAMGPLSNPSELGGDLKKVLSSLTASEKYVAMFEDAFGADSVSIENVTKAIASFERTLIRGNSGVDQFRSAKYEALNREARQGMWIFESRGGCWKCHSGPNFTDEAFHNTGVSFGQKDRDTGRFQFTGKEVDRFRFKTPSLRDVERTAPYMHDGSMKTLEEVVEFYSKGGSRGDSALDEKMLPINLTDEEKVFLVEFLKALNSNQ